MVKRKERKLEWGFKQKEKGVKNKECAYLCGIGIRWFQELYARYKMTKKIPQLNWDRRPERNLTSDEEALIDKAIKESSMNGAVYLRLHIKKYYGKNIPHNKVHKYLLRKGIAREDEKKKKQRVYHLYERDHSFSLVHLDWHVSKVIPDKQVCAVEDDASRLIICGGEFDKALEEYTIKLMKDSISKVYSEYSAAIKQVNTDKGSQFYANKKAEDGEKGLSGFEKFLQDNGIEHIPSRRNHPQTNGKQERWFRTYEENRLKFKSFNEFIEWYNHKIHLGLSRKEGTTPNEAIIRKLRPESLLGLFFRRFM